MPDQITTAAELEDLLCGLNEDGHEPYLVLDATVALDARGRRARASLPSIRRGGPARREEAEGATFKIDVKDLHFLRSVGIDPTRAPRAPRGRRRTGTTASFRSTVAKRV